MNQSKFKLRALPLVLLASLGVLSACGGGGGATGATAVGSTASVNDKNGNPVMVASSAGTVSNLAMSAVAPGAAPALNFVNGFFSYNITGLTNGQTVTVTMTLPTGTAPTQAIKCLTVPVAVCADLVGLGKASIVGDVITLTLTDGDAQTDNDGAANGTIVDPVGPANADKLTGTTEPLFTYQWGLKKVGSYFANLTGINFTANDGMDLNVETAHNGTYTGNDGKEVKGKGVNVLVLDDGVDIRNEDLLGRVDVTQTRNFDFASDAAADSEFGKFKTADVAAMKAKDDPTPIVKDGNNVGASHGTNVAGIILATQNGKGVMGIAPRATLGGASYLGTKTGDANQAEAYGGGDWAKKADVINASFGSNPAAPPSYDPEQNGQTVRGLVNLRGGKGALFVKATGNEFGGLPNATPVRTCTVTGGGTPMKGIMSCETPANDLEGLEQNVMMVGAVNANGQKSSYSNGGGVNWVMGLGGEFGGNGTYGEAKGADAQGNADAGNDGPTMFSTDLRTCNRGYSNDAAETIKEDYRAVTAFLKGLTKDKTENANCDYSYMNGTSAATPTVTGVVALMLSANPNLGWRDIREILAGTAKPVDANYATRVNTSVKGGGFANPFNLVERRFATTDDFLAGNQPCKGSEDGALADGRQCAVLDVGTQQTLGYAVAEVSGEAAPNNGNGIALKHSLWYGFGLVDSKAAVEAAKRYTKYLRNDIKAADMPDFAAISYTTENTPPAALSYGKVTKLGSFTLPQAVNIGQIQLRVSADSLCIGSVGFMLVSNTTKRIVLSTPLNSYYSLGGQAAVSAVSNYTLGSYAMYGVQANTNNSFEVYAIATRPNAQSGQSDSCAAIQNGNFDNVSTGTNGMKVEWRILPRVLDLKDGSGQAPLANPQG